uniref:HTH OST-type domain-containing protein n=1 Tax=Strongyloides stercoralis TaxID=6248 RepID=A0A0K0EJ93_STRER
MELEDLFKKLRSSLSMRNNVPLSQLINECNSDWNINVWGIYSKLAGISNVTLKDIVTWLEGYESVTIKPTDNNDYIICFQFGNEHADLRRYINVSKPKKKKINKKVTSTSGRMRREERNCYNSSQLSNTYRNKHSFLTPVNNYYQKNVNVRSYGGNDGTSKEIKNFSNTVSSSGKTHLRNEISNALFMNKRLENQRGVEKLEKEIVKKFDNDNYDETFKKMNSLTIGNKVSFKSVACQTEETFYNNDFKNNVKTTDEKVEKNNKNDLPKYIFGADAIEILLKERNKVIPKATENLPKKEEEEEKKVEEKIETNHQSEKLNDFEDRKPFIPLQSSVSNQKNAHIYERSISKNISYNDINAKKVVKKEKFSYNFPTSSVA